MLTAISIYLWYQMPIPGDGWFVELVWGLLKTISVLLAASQDVALIRCLKGERR